MGPVTVQEYQEKDPSSENWGVIGVVVTVRTKETKRQGGKDRKPTRPGDSGSERYYAAKEEIWEA